MDDFQKKTLETSRGFQYTYWVLHASTNKPALLLQHGFPDDHELWSNIIPYLRPLDYTIIVPDQLGYGRTAKPSDPQAYCLRDQADDMIDILNNEKQQYAVSVGHDWGSSLAQRVALFHPDRIAGLVLFNIAYRPPEEMDFEKTNERLIKLTGLPRLAYQQFFVSPHARDLLEADLECSFTVLHGSNDGTESFMEDLLCHYGALESYLKAKKRQPLKEYAKAPGFKETWIARMKRDGFEGPLNWYHASHKNINWDKEKSLPRERYRLDMPVLFIGSTADKVGLTQYIYVPQEAGLLPDLKIAEVEAGHWQTFENPRAGGEILAGWLNERGHDLMAKL